MVQALLCNTNNSIWDTVKDFQVLLCITNNSIKHYSFVSTYLNDQTVLFFTIRFNVEYLIVHS